MANRPARYSKSEVAAALDPALDRGLPLTRYDITVDGTAVTMTVHFIGGATATTNITSLEERCEASAKARRVAGRRG